MAARHHSLVTSLLRIQTSFSFARQGGMLIELFKDES